MPTKFELENLKKRDNHGGNGAYLMIILKGILEIEYVAVWNGFI
jgi:hypothetical protein